MNKSNFFSPERNPDLDPVSYYNKYKFDHSINIFLDKNRKVKKENEHLLVVPDSMGNTVEFDISKGYLFTAQSNNQKIQPNIEYTPFMLLVKFKFKGNYYGAYSYIDREFLNAHIPYIRVGVDYFKLINKIDRFGIDRKEIKRWKKEEIKQDHGPEILKYITKYDDFIINPNNEVHTSTIGNSYNLYSEFSHIPKKGKWKWTKIMIEHVFGGQYELGLKYLQVLYLYPKQALPILVLGSTERSTGKTTFLNWMAQIFGANYAVITTQDFTSDFNTTYAFSNIIGIEETVDDKAATVNKIKGLATGKFVAVNQKHIDNYKLPFYGKFILTTNKPESFLKIDEEEIRFWVRSLSNPKIKNTNIEEDMVKEIPAFLHYLTTLPKVDFSKSRMVFTPEEIATNFLKKAKKESKSGLYTDLTERLLEWFETNLNIDVLYFRASDIQNEFYKNNKEFSIKYISRVLKSEMYIEPKMVRQKCNFIENIVGVNAVGNWFELKRTDFYKLLEINSDTNNPKTNTDETPF